ncbi:MAG: hypothetical protein WBE72_08235 [Terracidiphilus sp.]
MVHPFSVRAMTGEDCDDWIQDRHGETALIPGLIGKRNAERLSTGSRNSLTVERRSEVHGEITSCRLAGWENQQIRQLEIQLNSMSAGA